MIDLLESGAEVVRSAEVSLRDLIQAAANRGQYDQVAILANWAEHLAEIGKNEARRPKENALQSNSQAQTTHKKKSTSAKGRKGRKGQYPIFKRSGDTLIKIGWSKASNSEYHHQAPKEVVFSLLNKAVTLFDEDRLITMEQIFPLQREDKREVPSYQGYASLAWLRSIGVVKQHGRRGYSVLLRLDTRQAVEQEWAKLPLER